MFIVDRELERREASGAKIRVGMVGAGFMARGIARQILRYVPGVELVAISNRNLEGGRQAYAESGVVDVVHVTSAGGLDDCIASGRPAITSDPMVICDSKNTDVLLE